MSSEPLAVSVRGLGKRYRTGERRPYKTIRDALGGMGRRGGPRDADGHLWAVRDVSFELAHGEALGVIGRNGSGKSTLLKLLSRITPPTAGSARIAGRVGSLLEVGTGFHPELTGRENVHLNGAILGMRRLEIYRKYEEIVNFAGLERFMETPVKRYSSGMYMRLAFAVAAHLEPEILIVNEVLAVGDAAFQRKCLGKMGEVANQGRTVIFVSHNMTALESLCPRTLWLDGGRLVAEGDSSVVVAQYLQSSLHTRMERSWPVLNEAPGDDSVRLRAGRVRSVENGPSGQVTTATPIAIDVEYLNMRPGAGLGCVLHICNARGEVVFRAAPSGGSCWAGGAAPGGLLRETCTIPGDLLNDGVHRVELFLVLNETTVLVTDPDFLSFEVHDDPSLRGSYHGPWGGAVRPRLAWNGTVVADTAHVAAVTDSHAATEAPGRSGTAGF